MIARGLWLVQQEAAVEGLMTALSFLFLLSLAIVTLFSDLAFSNSSLLLQVFGSLALVQLDTFQLGQSLLLLLSLLALCLLLL